ncbi:MAG TPA: 2-hydroxyacid dehydrogenase [Afifellaceae bacterium]|nr:2-hydroxyacid dehydrogenase [Afifellaceae bacterium]
MKPVILCASRLMDHAIKRLEADYDLRRLDQAEDREAFLKEVGPSVRAIATGGGADAALMDACPNLEIISSFGVGYDNVDSEHAKSRGIAVCNTPDVLNDEVANTAIMLLLAVSRKLVAYDRYVREGRWVKEGNPPLTNGIAGKKVGIVGLGRIGKAIAEKLAVFHCEISYFGRNKQDDVSFPYFSDPVELAKACDALIVITPGGSATRHLISADVIDALGPDGILVNVARGTVVDEKAMVDALANGRLGGAGLDVFEEEPKVPEALFAMDHVVLQPHQGSATVETRQAMADRMVDNLVLWLDGKPPLSRAV